MSPWKYGAKRNIFTINHPLCGCATEAYSKENLSSVLTSNESIVATITPEYYPDDTYVSNNGTISVDEVSVLAVGTGVALSDDIVGRFAVTPKKNEESNTETAYAIDSSGMLYLGE